MSIHNGGFKPNELVFDFKLIDVENIIAAKHDDVIDIPIAEKREVVNISITNEKNKFKAHFVQKHFKPLLYELNDKVVVENVNLQ